MRAKVTARGVIIPKKLLKGADEVEIRREQNVLVIVPKMKDDPLLKLGRKPVECNAPDASENLDRYLY